MKHYIGVPGPIDPRTEVVIPGGVKPCEGAHAKIVMHNDPSIDSRKSWPWQFVQELVARVRPGDCVLLGHPGPPVRGALDLRGKTTLPEAAAVISVARCFLGIDSGLMWIAGSLGVPSIGLYGTSYIPNCKAVQPHNPLAQYLDAPGSLDLISVEMVLRAISEVRPRGAVLGC